MQLLKPNPYNLRPLILTHVWTVEKPSVLFCSFTAIDLSDYEGGIILLAMCLFASVTTVQYLKCYLISTKAEEWCLQKTKASSSFFKNFGMLPSCITFPVVLEEALLQG